jgi:hypothetical protein
VIGPDWCQQSGKSRTPGVLRPCSGPSARRVPLELPGHWARLPVRTRANYSPRAPRFLTLPLGLFDATYGVAQLRAIARRAESPHLSGP